MDTDTLSLIVVSDETAPVRRFELRKSWIKRSLWGAGVVAVLLLGLMVDYVRVRMDNRELDSLRSETVTRRTQVTQFEEQLSGVDRQLMRLQELERKIRIIANLPGSAGAGGDDITAVGNGGDQGSAPGGRGGDFENAAEGAPMSRPGRVPSAAPEAEVEQRVSLLREAAVSLGVVADDQALTLLELVNALEGKRTRLASSPSIWPAKGWLTSRYGYRVSPFTGRRQFHAGLDIAGERGTEVVAPAQGKVVFAGKKGPLGNTVIIDHGYGVRTTFGHNHELFVKRGEEVQRGQVISALGNSGRSTGPHLHYVVEVGGKTRNPLDYIFD